MAAENRERAVSANSFTAYPAGGRPRRERSDEREQSWIDVFVRFGRDAPRFRVYIHNPRRFRAYRANRLARFS